MTELLSVTNLRKKEDPFLTKVSVTVFDLSYVLLTISKNLLRDLLRGTNDYWNAWIRRSTYDGSWKEAVHRSALALKLLTYEPTGSLMLILMTVTSHSTLLGAVVASPTFSLPEFIGGTRNWCVSASQLTFRRLSTAET